MAPINDIATNPEGVIVVSPGWVADAPSVTEVCLRKVDAVDMDGQFASNSCRRMSSTCCRSFVPASMIVKPTRTYARGRRGASMLSPIFIRSTRSW